MIKKLAMFPLAALVALSACGTITNETYSTIVVDDDTYKIRTRTIDGANGTYQTSSVQVYGLHYQCLPESKGDCEAAVREGLDAPIDRF
ncbi:MAG: hypothetical protein R8G34_18295 [Paracoccaceae bacterium]|nr:hypothetical protein [Paracoccaceae bacterium]